MKKLDQKARDAEEARLRALGYRPCTVWLTREEFFVFSELLSKHRKIAVELDEIYGDGPELGITTGLGVDKD